jgi:hypothetical protein
MKLLLSFALFITCFNAFSLEIDEKLTLRIVNTSDSKKTILINRGIEDGLAKGDHAKFFVSIGVVARGVAIKVSPTRSVWSVYRIVNKEYLRDEQVLKLKITPAVKITKDESQMLVSDDSSFSVSKDPRDIGIALSDGADDLDKVEGGKVQTNTEWINDESISLIHRNKEVFGMVHYSSSTEQTTPDNTSGKYSQTVTDLILKIGGEWYFKTETEWYSRFSFLSHFAMERKSIMAYQGSYVKEESSEFGFGTNLYLFSRPSVVHSLVPYLNYTLSLGSTNSSYTSGEGSTEDISLDASVMTNSFAFGFKYYTSEGFGVRAEMAYQLRGELFAKGQDNTSWVKTRVGPKMNFGLSYRF